MSPDDVTDAVERARAAQPAWEALGFAERGRILRRMQKWTLDNSERIIATIVAENGKTYEDAQLAEVSYAASAFGFWAKNAPDYLADEKVRSASPFVLGRKLVVRYAPVGVVGVIGPWNYPLTNSFGDCIPALAAGNSVVLKPATLTPMTSLLMAEGLRECGVPEDVFQVAVGEGSSIGNALIDAVDFIMFTGSTEVGKKVMERAARDADRHRDGARRQGPDDRPAATPTSSAPPTRPSTTRCRTAARPASRSSASTSRSPSTRTSSAASPRRCACCARAFPAARRRPTSAR